MKKLILAILLLALPVQAANTIQYRDNSDLVTMSQISTTGTNSTTALDLGLYQSGSIQCVWAAVTGTQPIYKLQVSNNNSNWDDVSGASTVTVGAAGSGTWMLSPIVSRYARISVATASSTGTLDCKGVFKK